MNTSHAELQELEDAVTQSVEDTMKQYHEKTVSYITLTLNEFFSHLKHRIRCVFRPLGNVGVMRHSQPKQLPATGMKDFSSK